jgi:hypothetical protein
MGFAVFDPPTKEEFDINELHKKVGRMIVTMPTDSDLQEGMFMAKLWFMCENGKMYLIKEWKAI